MWLDDCRIPFVNEGDIPNDMDKTHLDGRNFYTQVYNGFMYNQNTQGRFAPNLLVCDDMLNDGSVTSIKQNKDYIPPNEPDSIVGFSRGKYSGINDKGTNSRYYDLDKWFDKVIDSL